MYFEDIIELSFLFMILLSIFYLGFQMGCVLVKYHMIEYKQPTTIEYKGQLNKEAVQSLNNIITNLK